MGHTRYASRPVRPMLRHALVNPTIVDNFKQWSPARGRVV